MAFPTLNYQLDFVIQDCIECGISFGVPDAWDARRREDHKSMFCPNGHSQNYTGKTAAQKLQELLDAEKRRVEMFRRENQEKERAITALKGQVTKTKRRLARTENGVCPECNRTFANVARHMQSKHGIECNQPPKGSKVRELKVK